MKKERTTKEVALALSVSLDAIQAWKRRDRIPLAPKGNANGQGRGNDLMWSEEAFQQAKEYAERRQRPRPVEQREAEERAEYERLKAKFEKPHN